MKQVLQCLIAAFVIAISGQVFSIEQCSNISCDCAQLPTESWQKACQNQEARLIASCVKGGEEVGYCSLHGPMANRLPLDFSPKQVELFATEEVPNLNNRVAILYWGIIKDFDSLESSLSKADYAGANRKLNTIQSNVDSLFVTQEQVTKSFNSENMEAQAQSAWRDYSADTLSFGSDFFIRAESILNTYDNIENESDRQKARILGLKLMQMAGVVYEQVGYSYASGVRHKHAAKAWKNAADASALIMAHRMENDARSSDFYRQQSAARLHRASYHWVIGSGRGSAEESLAESQKFMEDGSSITGLVEEERRINQSKPYWSK